LPLEDGWGPSDEELAQYIATLRPMRGEDTYEELYEPAGAGPDFEDSDEDWLCEQLESLDWQE
jgi:hypothetical protein